MSRIINASYQRCIKKTIRLLKNKIVENIKDTRKIKSNKSYNEVRSITLLTSFISGTSIILSTFLLFKQESLNNFN